MTRRDWLSVSAALWAEIAAAQHHAVESVKTGAAPKQVLTGAEAAEIEALASQIIPSDGSPGAKEAGVIYFIDRALATFDRDQLPVYRKGLEQMQATRKRLFPGSASIAGLTGEQQIALLKAEEKSEFFELLRTHTILGFLGHPSYGGNRDCVGWKHLGFEDRMGFEPPFGFYDRDAK
jgi:gluconate 2-dehydrogenase gamma chain